MDVFRNFRQKTEVLEAQSAQWLGGSGVIRRRQEQLLVQVQDLENGSTQMAQGTNLPRWEGDMDISHKLCRLQQDVNQLSVQKHQTTAFMGGKFTKTVQESSANVGGP